jgi:hypothetical protein
MNNEPTEPKTYDQETCERIARAAACLMTAELLRTVARSMNASADEFESGVQDALQPVSQGTTGLI